MEINITWNLCRVCLLEETKVQPQMKSNEHQMRNIFNDDKQLATQIYECSGVTMKPNDSLPEKICKKCYIMVKHAANFRKTCRNSDAYLKSIIQQTKSASSSFKLERYNIFNFLDDDLINEEKTETDHKESDDVGIKEEILATHKRKSSESSQEEHFYKKAQMEIEIDMKNAEDLIVNEDDIIENDLNHIVEMEEFLNNTKHAENKLGEQEEKAVPGIQDFEVQNTYNKLSPGQTTDDSDLSEETNEKQSFKHDSDELYYLLKGVKENKQNSDTVINVECHEHEDNVEFIPEEEEDKQQQLHSESEMDDSQAQVSSTVDTKEDFIELQDQNSNISEETNGTTTEYVVDEYLIDDSESNIKTGDSNVVVVNKKLSSVIVPTDKRRTKVILSNRKICSDSTTSSTSAGKYMHLSNSRNKPQIYVCDICGNHFSNRQLMNAHMKVHRQEKNHECELCLKRFITACNLQAHMRIHTGEKPFECQYCSRRFSDRSSHLRHERIHTNEKPYQCNDCGKSFSLATTLKKHLKIHTGERLYRCDPCSKAFKLSHQLKAHISTSLHKAVIQLAELNK